LKKKRIYKIDMVFITHYDYDHYGALEELQKTCKINQVYDYTSTFPVKMGGITFNNYNYYGAGRSEENDKSLVLGFNFLNKDFLVMGDAPTFVERQIIKNENYVPCDILRVGHHGSNTSTCEEWIKFVTPEEAVISVGKGNKFGHPNKEVIAVLNKYKIKIRRTDIEGTIKYKSIFV
ncbi:MAG: MBL fold metallo-hydrolase, partial [Bacilli bacterium]|nr:MBL fold metallo-hydrolase [Bacilli bacterium]